MKIKIGMLWGLVAMLAIGFILTNNTTLSWDYVTTKRLLRLAAMVVGAICVTCSAIMFQTLVGNRILTPAIMGYEAVYLFWQSLLLLLMGTQGIAMLGVSGNFIISAILMLLYSWLIHHWLFKRSKNDVYLLLLLGLVLSMVIGTFSQFIQLRINPAEFMVFQGLSFASFNRVQPETLLYAVLALLIVAIAMYKTRHVLDVMALGGNSQSHWVFIMRNICVLPCPDCDFSGDFHQFDWACCLYGHLYCQSDLCTGEPA